MIRISLETKVNSDDLDRYLSILDEHSFDFDLRGYESNEANFFRYGGNYHDTIITNEQMKIFLDENQNLFNTLTNQYIKKLNYFKNHEFIFIYSILINFFKLRTSMLVDKLE